MKVPMIMALAAMGSMAAIAHAGPAADCHVGAYRLSDGGVIDLAPDEAGLRYRLFDGTTGALRAAGDGTWTSTLGWTQRPDGKRFVLGPCGTGELRVDGVTGRRIDFDVTETRFQGRGVELAGRLVLPKGRQRVAIAVLIHGSEDTSARKLYSLQRLLPAQGIGVFVYDKRGTGESGGAYTQDFGVLADDAVAAMREARRLAGDRAGRIGYQGGSQGGWVAPLAATRAPVDFVVVSFGLAVSPIEEDQQEVELEMRLAGHGPDAIAKALELARSAEAVFMSGFTDGIARFDALRARDRTEPWYKDLRGNMTRLILPFSAQDLREKGPAYRFGTPLQYDSMPVLRAVQAPQLWILGEDDLEAPSAETAARIKSLAAQGRPITLAMFPHAEHGMTEYEGSRFDERMSTRYAAGYFEMMRDFMRDGRLGATYGGSVITRPAKRWPGRCSCGILGISSEFAGARVGGHGRARSTAAMRTEPDLGAVFDASPNAYMILDRELRYVAANCAYCAVTAHRRDELIGRRLIDVFPHDPANPANDKARRLVRSLRRVFETGERDVLPTIQYRIAVGGVEQDRYWSASHTPLFDDAGHVEYVLQHTVDITELHHHVDRQPGSAAGVIQRAEVVQERNRWLHDAFDQAPVALVILRGSSHVVEVVNERACAMWGRTRDQVQDRPLLDALPEIASQGIGELLETVWRTRAPYIGTERPVELVRGGKRELIYFTFVYQPMVGAGGLVDSVIVVAVDVTQEVLTRRKVETAQAELQAIFEAERTARAQAESANRAKDQFLAMVSHELRTPLTAILGWTQMLRTGILAAEKQQRALDTIERNARIQAQLVDDLLDVARILAGKLEVELEPVEIASVVAAAVETVRPAAESKDVRIEVAVESTAPLIGDSRRLQQVVWNLLSNAVKFTPRGGLVTLRVERREGNIVITVTDTGAGIAPELLPHVFERFRQAENVSTRRAGGLGLGLSIAHHIVTAHRGEIRAYSDGPGKGAQFVVLLPAAIVSSHVHGDHADTTLEIPAELAGRRVLVVDDETDMREYVGTLLRHAGMRVTAVASACEALAEIDREVPDMIVSDLAMPDVDGYQLIQRIRALPGARGRMPAIALTAFARPEDRVRVMRAGFQNHVAKPLDPAELFAVLVAFAA